MNVFVSFIVAESQWLSPPFGLFISRKHLFSLSGMKYFKEERLVIGERIYDDEISRREAMEVYGIGEHTAMDHMRPYRTLKKQLWYNPRPRSG